MKVSTSLRKLAAVAGMMALLATGDPLLAQVLFAPPQTCDCNMLLCPMHHPAPQHSTTLTASAGPTEQSWSDNCTCSMTSCEGMQFHLDSCPPLVQVAPTALYAGEMVQPAPGLTSLPVTSAFRPPVSPPPRIASA